MKTLKIILLSILSVLTAVYLAFLFVLPYAIDLDKYAPQLTNEIEKNTGFKVKAQGLKVTTAWNLSAGALVNKADLMYPTGEKFAQINNLQVRLSLLPLFLKQLRVDSVSLDKIIVNLKVDKSGKFLIENYLPKSTPESSQKTQLPFKFSSSMPVVKAEKYRITFIDTETNRSYSLKGQDFKVSNFVLDKKIKVKAKGELVLNDRKQISYDLSLFSKLFPQQEKKAAVQPKTPDIIGVFEELYKYNLKADVKADLKVTGDEKNQEIDGKIGLNKISFVLGGKTLPQSNLNLVFKGDKVKINSDFYTDLDEKAVITGVFNNGRKKSVNLNVASEKTDLANTFLIANTLLHMLGNNNLEGVSAKGHLNANFNLKSDFKTIQSKGFLKIEDASVVHNLYKASLNSINADVDFSQNSIDIKKFKALLNNQPIVIKGFVDSKANADISVFAQNLQLRGLFATLGQMQILRENGISSGLVSIKASVKGRLDKAVPTVDIVLNNVDLKNKPNNARIKFANANIKAVSTGKNHDKFSGKMAISSLKVYPSAAIGVVSVPNLKLSFDEKNLNIDNALLFLNNSKIDVFGKVNNYSNSKINIDITAKGLMVSKDIKSMIPSQNRAGVEAVGKIPLLVRITGGAKQEIYAQMLANRTNHVSIFDINTLRGKTSLISAQMDLAPDGVKIHEIGIYSLNSNKGLSSNMKANAASAVKIATVSGRISDLTSVNPVLDGVSVEIPNQIATSIPGFSGSSVKIKGELNINGRANRPEIKGYLSVPSIEIPTIKTKLKSTVLHFNKNSISLNCPQLTVANSLMGFNSIINNDFSTGVLINSIDFYSSYLDLDTLASAMAGLPKSSASADLGVSISSGKGHINKVKTGGMLATNVSSNFILKNNVLKMNNLTADAYLGKVAGGISYNLINGNVALDLQGRGLSAGPAIKGLTGMPDKITGSLDFDSNISTAGVSQQQIIRNLKGDTQFIISNGKMGTLGKLEHLLYAQNILSNSFFKTSLNVIAKAVSVKNTGVFKYIKGKMTFSNGWANISSMKTSGPSMSMYVTGRYNLLDGSANLVILGRLSDDVVRLLGPIGDFSMDKMLSYIPKLGNITSYVLNQITANPDYENTSLIPNLTPKTELPTKEFKVMINGGIESQSSIKSFKWLSKPQVQTSQTSTAGKYQPGQYTQTQVKDAARQVLQQVVPKYLPQNTTIDSQTPERYTPPKKIVAPVADFINSLPDLKE